MKIKKIFNYILYLIIKIFNSILKNILILHE